MADSDFGDTQPQILARIAALQRLREQMAQEKREAVLHSIDSLIAQEMRSLRDAQERDCEDR